MNALAKFGLATVLVTLAVLSNVLVTLSALSGAHAQIQARQPEALYWQTFRWRRNRPSLISHRHA